MSVSPEGLRFFSSTESNWIPGSPGLYAFYLRPITARSIGLIGNEDWSDETLSKFRGRVLRKTDDIMTLIGNCNLEGEISEPGKASHLSSHFSLRVNALPPSVNFMDALGEFTSADLRSIINTVGKIALLSHPIYVGITIKKTLQERYLQHRSDFFSSPASESTFGGRLRVTNFEWSDVAFGCLPMNKNEISPRSIKFLEKYFQTLTKPVLSQQ